MINSFLETNSGMKSPSKDDKLRLRKDSQDFDMSGWSYQDYICTKLNKHLRDLSELRNGLSKISQDLIFDFPLIKHKHGPLTALNTSSSYFKNRETSYKKKPKFVKEAYNSLQKFNTNMVKEQNTKNDKEKTKSKVTIKLNTLKKINCLKVKSPADFNAFNISKYKWKVKEYKRRIHKQLPIIIKKSPYRSISKNFKDRMNKHILVRYKKCKRSSMSDTIAKNKYSFHN